MTIVMLGGGIRVGSIFALANVTSLALINRCLGMVSGGCCAIVVGALAGLVNGVLIEFPPPSGLPDHACFEFTFG